MSDKKPKRVRYLTPVGGALFAHVIEPDAKFHPENPEYHLRLVLSAKDAAELAATIEKAMPEAEEAKRDAEAESRKKGKKVDLKYSPFMEPMVDPDTGDELDTVKFGFKSKSLYKDKTGALKPLDPPAIFNVKGTQLSGDALPKFIGSGSRIRVLFEVIPWASAGLKLYGLSLRLIAVKIIELRRGGGVSADAMGGDESEEYEGRDDEADSGEDDGSGDF